MGVFQSASSSCTVRTGPHAQPMQAGETVAHYRRTMSMAHPIDPAAKAHIGTTEVSEDYVVQPGQELTFIRPTGQKG